MDGWQTNETQKETESRDVWDKTAKVAVLFLCLWDIDEKSGWCLSVVACCAAQLFADTHGCLRYALTTWGVIPFPLELISLSEVQTVCSGEGISMVRDVYFPQPHGLWIQHY